MGKPAHFTCLHCRDEVEASDAKLASSLFQSSVEALSSAVWASCGQLFEVHEDRVVRLERWARHGLDKKLAEAGTVANRQ